MYLFLLLLAMVFQSAAWSTHNDQVQIPHEKMEFIEHLGKIKSALETAFLKDEGKALPIEKLLKTSISIFLDEKLLPEDEIFSELSFSPDLQKKLLSLLDKKEEKSKGITFSELKSILEKHSDKFTEEEKGQLYALFLAHLQKQGDSTISSKAALQNVLNEFLSILEKTAPRQAIQIPEELRKLFKLPEGKTALFPKDLKKLIEENKTISPANALAVLGKAAPLTLKNVESLDRSTRPALKQAFQSLGRQERRRGRAFSIPQDLSTALNAIEQMEIVPLTPQERERRFGGFNIPIIPPIFESGERGFSGGNGGNDRGRNIFHNYRGPILGEIPNTPRVSDTRQLKQCLDHIKENRFNVELKLPGALCAATPLAHNPVSEKKALLNSGSPVCEVTLGTAVHCLDGMQLEGREIGIGVSGQSVPVRVLSAKSVSNLQGPPVENGNPDLATMVVQVACNAVNKMHFARVPSLDEIKTRQEAGEIPLILQQNSNINANLYGENRATIAASGSLGNGSSNFLRFNSKSGFNNVSEAGDSSHIQSGDSGGAALTCTFDSQGVKDVLYMGAISHVDVGPNGNAPGYQGGVASGQSLIALSQQFKRDGGSSNLIARHNTQSHEPLRSHQAF